MTDQELVNEGTELSSESTESPRPAQHKCERCGGVASFSSSVGGVIQERLCGECRLSDVKAANLLTIQRQQQERSDLGVQYGAAGTPIIVFVRDDKNLGGDYVASVANPINSCGVGFGSTPVRALRELALKLADDADRVLHSIREQEFERRQLETELSNTQDAEHETK